MAKPIKIKTPPIFKYLATILLILQVVFWYGIKTETDQKDEKGDPIYNYVWKGTKEIKPELEITPKVPSKSFLKFFSFGDEEAAFRYHAYKMHFVGDTFGRVTPLKNYDYKELYKWWSLLDETNSVSSLLPYLVGYYYSSTQNPKEQLPYVVKFLEEHSDKHPEDKWWWYSQAVYNAKFRIEDTETALRIARKLANLPKELDIPIWTRQLEAFIYEEKGEYSKACDIIVKVVEDFADSQLTEGEMNFIFHFVQERLRALIDLEGKTDISKMDISPECRYMMEAQKATDIKNQVKIAK